ncbi:MAG TPA: SCO family protein [Isosphaeraceae bacterium]|nr:SCO family protein [Isosphaeraceae bacterium]
MARILTAIAVFTLLVGLPACSSQEPPEPSTRPEQARKDSGRIRSFLLTGTVRQVDRDSGEVSIAHEEIAGFMPAMTMPFNLKGQEVLKELQVGDRVEGTLLVESSRSRLEGVEITEEAPPPTLSLSMKDGKVSLREKAPVLEPGQKVPDFSMTTQSGETLALSDLRGKTVVLTFVYTRCPLPEYCPLMDKKFAEIARRVALRGDRARDVRLLSVSFDPEHDTPDVLEKHAAVVGARPPLWRFAVAAHDELRKVAEPLGLMYAPMSNEIAHSLSTAVIGPDGRLIRLERGSAWTVNELMAGIPSHSSPEAKSGAADDELSETGKARD